MKLSEVRKAVVAGIGSVVTLLVAAQDSFSPWLHGSAVTVLAAVVAGATAVATYLTRNEVAGVIDKF